MLKHNLRIIFWLSLCLLLNLTANPLQAQTIPDYQISHIFGRGDIRQIEWQANHAQFLVASTTGLWLYNASFELERTITLPEQSLSSAELAFASIEWSPDGKTLAIGAENRIWLWDSQEDSFRIFWNEASAVSIRWSPNGEFIAFTDDDGMVHLLNVDNATELTVWNASLYQIEWNFDGTRLLGIHTLAAGTRLVVWDTERLEQIAQLRISNIAVGSVLWNPNRNLIAIKADDLLLWQIENDEQTIVPINRYDKLSTFEWSPDGDYLAIGTNRHLLIHNLDTAEQVSFDYRQGIGRIAWSPVGDKLALTLENGTNQDVEILDTNTWQLETQLSHPIKPHQLLWDTSGQYLLTRTSHSHDEALRGWDINTGRLINTIYEHFRVPNEDNLAWSPDSTQIVLNPQPFSSTYALIVDAQSSQAQDIVRVEYRITRLDWNSQSGLLAIVSHETTQYHQSRYQIIIWNPQSHSEINRLEGSGSVWAKWNPDGTKLALLFGDNSIALWDIGSSESQMLLAANETYRIEAFDWSPDGTKLALAVIRSEALEGVDVIDASDTQLILELCSDCPRDGIWTQYNVDWSPLGDVITGTIAGSHGGQIFWNSSSGEILNTRTLSSAIDWHPSGEYIALNNIPYDTGPDDYQDIFLVNPRIAEPPRILHGHRAEIFLLFWSPDGRKLLSGDFNGLAMIWEQAN